MGLQNSFIVAALVGLTQTLTFFLFVKYGRHMREISVRRYLEYVKEMAAAGLIH